MTGTRLGPIPLVVAAKNEERALGATLEALLGAVDHAAREGGLRIETYVVMDDTVDGTADVVARFPRVHAVRSTGGKVEAQRAGLAAFDARHREPPPFAIFCDADVLPTEDALLAVCATLASDAEVIVATCALCPLPPRRRTLLARAVHAYNRRRGFSSSRTWFNGKLFAMRGWSVPTRLELAELASRLPPDPFYDLGAGLVVDDIFLSRKVVKEHGVAAIRESPRGGVSYRAPETLRGMTRYYRRMRRELERLDLLFPDTCDVHRRHGVRRADLLGSASLREKMYYAIFSTAILVCRAAYVAERAWVRRVARSPRPAAAWWPPVEETKA